MISSSPLPLILALLLLPIAEVQAQLLADAPLRFSEQQLTQGDVRVNLVESAISLYSAKVPTRSLVFVIEHLGEKALTSGSSNLQFLNAERELIILPVPDDERMRVSGSVAYDFGDYLKSRRKFEPNVELPQPQQPARAWVSLQWFREPVPEQAAFLQVNFSGEKFVFPLKK